jgi:hypothetical protein
LTENPIVVDDDENGEMIVDNPGMGSESTDRDAGSATQLGEVVVKSDLNDDAILQYDDRSAIVIFIFLSPKIPESDSRAILDEEGQLYPSL